MGTHITDRPEIQVDGTEEVFSYATVGPVTDRLNTLRSQNEGEPRPPEAMVPSPSLKPRRNGLMITACTLAVLVAAGGVFWISPYNHTSIADLPRLVSQAKTAVLDPTHGFVAQGLALLAPVAPAARLARAPEPSGSITPSRTPAPVSAGPHPIGDDMAEFLRLGGQTPASAPSGPEKRVDVPSAQSAASVEPHVPPAVLATPKVSVAVNVPSAVPKHPDPVPQAAVPEQHAPAGVLVVPKDAVAAIAVLRPAPMTDAQQVQVLDLVTRLGTLVRDQRAQVAQLRQDQQNLVERVDGSLSDITRRISLSEASSAVGAASGEPRLTPVAAWPPVATPVAARVAVPVVAAVPVDTGPHRYHVQAASPGLAMLSELDPSGGEQRQLPISPGDTVPGWGKVVSISQRGTSWVVKTDHGLIQ